MTNEDGDALNPWYVYAESDKKEWNVNLDIEKYGKKMVGGWWFPLNTILNF